MALLPLPYGVTCMGVLDVKVCDDGPERYPLSEVQS